MEEKCQISNLATLIPAYLRKMNSCNLPSYIHLGNTPSQNYFVCYFLTLGKTNQLKKCQKTHVLL